MKTDPNLIKQLIEESYNGQIDELKARIKKSDADICRKLNERELMEPNTLTTKDKIIKVTDQLATFLCDKNEKYKDSAINPMRVFSKSDRLEQINVRIDDKLSRIANGDTSEDAEWDLIGYLILKRVALMSLIFLFIPSCDPPSKMIRKEYVGYSSKEVLSDSKDAISSKEVLPEMIIEEEKPYPHYFLNPPPALPQTHAVSEN